jgi:hypothetical protein
MKSDIFIIFRVSRAKMAARLARAKWRQKSSANRHLYAIEDLIRSTTVHPNDHGNLSRLEKCTVSGLISPAATIVCSVLFVVTGSLSSGAQAQSTGPVRGDTQVWSEVQIAVPLSKQVDFLMIGTVRLGRHVHRPVDQRLGAGFSYKAGEYLTLAPTYSYIRAQPTRGRNQSEDRLILAATVNAPAGKFTLIDRSAFERRYRHQQGVSTRYRNRFQIQHPFKLGDTQLNWFIADEVFYDWSFNEWSRNRFTIGVSRKFNQHLTTDLYYLRQNDGHSSPGDIHVIGTTFRFRR